MSRLVKIVDNKYVQIEEHRNPNILFNTNEYDDFEDYCTLRETFDPFKMFYGNQELKKQLEEINKMIEKCGFVKIGNDKEEIEKIFLDKYAWLPGSFGVTEQTYQLLEVNAKEIMNYRGERK